MPAGLVLITCIAASLFCQGHGDLGAALRRQGLGADTVQPPPEPLGGPLVVQLRKQSARPPVGRRFQHTNDGFYVGNISVGLPPQHLQVLFDTASGHLLLAHRACKSPACSEHRRYSPWESSTAADVNNDGGAVQEGAHLAKGPVNRTVVTVSFTQADLGEGNAQGVLVRDSVCLSSRTNGVGACASVAILAATHLDDQPFRAMPHDGILGLALEGLSAGPVSSFYERLLDGSPKLLPQFGMSFGPREGAIAFGGHDLSRLMAPLQWFPVDRPEDGFWQVKVHAVRVGNVTVDTCQGGCRGIIDTGSSSLGAQADRLSMILPHLLSKQGAVAACQGPALALDLGSFELTLGAEDYTGVTCKPELGLLDLDPKEFLGVYALGTTVLQRYYTAFDWAAARVGFAPIASGLSISGDKQSLLPFVQEVNV